MLVAGAKGHALEILEILLQQDAAAAIHFFDNLSSESSIATIRQFPLVHTEEQLEQLFKKDNRYVLGTGNPATRKKLAEYLTSRGGVLQSAIAPNAVISRNNVQLGAGLNIMQGVIIQPEVSIGAGTLVNAGVLLHHECTVGEYCEIGPGAVITGNVQVGNHTFIGAGAVILPGIKIGQGVKVGAGAVVIRDVEDHQTVAGNPAKPITKKN